ECRIKWPTSQFTQIWSPAGFLDGGSPEQGRVYTSGSPGFYVQSPRHEIHNLSARRGFHNAAGYEPLMTKRYGQTFGASWDFETPSFHAPPDPQILDPKWQGLDLLNVRFLIQTGAVQGWTEKDGAGFAPAHAVFNLPPNAWAPLTGASEKVDTLSLVTAMAKSAALPQNPPVAEVIIHTADGRRIEREMKAGVDTAEWAH